MFALYFTFGICAIFSGVAIQRFNYNYKMIILVSSLGYDAFMAAGVWVSACQSHDKTGACSEGVCYFIVILGAMLCGMGASTIWVNIL